MKQKGRVVCCPTGNWAVSDLIGACVNVKSVPVSNFFAPTASQGLTIKDILVRVSSDGKAITIVEIDGDEWSGKFVTWKDIEIVSLNTQIQKTAAVLGEFLCGETLCGQDVSTEPSYTDDLSNGITIIDDKGNVITNRYIRFIGASVEDLSTDADEITDIKVRPAGGARLD